MKTFSKTFVIKNKLGLHARASALLVKTTTRFISDITLSARKQSVNGKSIMGILMLAAAKGTKIQVKIQGEDAADAMKAIQELFEKKFGEE